MKVREDIGSCWPCNGCKTKQDEILQLSEQLRLLWEFLMKEDMADEAEKFIAQTKD